LEFAGANSSLFVFNNGVVTELKGDRKSVGARRTSRSYKFTTQVVDNPTGMFIMLTDGVTDVMNEMPQPTAFGRKRLTRVIESMNTSDPQLVVSRIMQEVDDYKGPGPLRDDLTLLAFYIDELKHFDKHSNIDSPPEEALEVI
jgi:serine phosphatase RsbU (regulator of sigma subunit)|tara:strand:+ start:74 stop:502 length:429 start_codon:yes stop_codon:yes gene_type:complete